MKRAFLLGLLAVGLTAGAGCCRLHAIGCYPCGPGMGPGPTQCDASCDEGCGTSCGDCGSCDSCAPCGRACYPCGPLTFVWELLHPASWCGGCGEAYFGDFQCDPDPCDRCGNWTGGGSCGSCGGVTQGTSGGCASCRSRSGAASSSTPVEGESQILSETDNVVSPSPNVPTKAAPMKAASGKAMPTAPAKPQPVSPEAARPIRSQKRR